MTSSNVSSPSGKAGEIDESLYSRQLYVLGREGMARMAQSNVLVVGMRGLGVEIAKNIALAGVKSLTICDPSEVLVADLGSQFFLREEDVGKPRAATTVPRMAELNKYVPVYELDHRFGDADKDAQVLQQYQAVVLTDLALESQLAISDICHRLNIRVVAAQAFGLFGSIFVDFGEDFTVYDADESEPIEGPIISIDDTGHVFGIPDQNIGLSEGDLIKITNVPEFGDPERIYKVIKKQTPDVVQIELSVKNFKFSHSGVQYKQVKPQFNLKFQSLRQQLENPDILMTDLFNFDRPMQLHLGFQALHQFTSANGRPPHPHDEQDAKVILDLATKLAKSRSEPVELDENIINEISYQAVGQIPAVHSALGGFAAQELLKAVSGKFTPLKQWLYFESLKSLPENSKRSKELCALQGNRYDGFVAVFGKEFHQKILNSKHFLVGAGAIGCEMLKVWAMMGLGSGPEGSIVLTDMDKIEKSNLNRQFLFRPRDVDQMKSTCAARAAAEMNPNYKPGQIRAEVDPVGANTEHAFTDSFWKSLNCVTNALDNEAARVYVDLRCARLKKPMLDSGTQGTKGSVQPVIPYLTELFSSSNDPPQKEIPMCTVRSFPYTIEHTLGWSKNSFNRLFKERSVLVNDFIKNEKAPTMADDVKLVKSVLDMMNKPSMHLSLRSSPLSAEDCIIWAREFFDEVFFREIKQLLHNFPADAESADGETNFWAPPKRAPHPVEFDHTNPDHVLFIESATFLNAETLGVGTRGLAREYIIEVAKAYRPAEFIPSDDVVVPTNEAQLSDLSKEKSDEKLERPGIVNFPTLVELEFEKDDDSNHHMDFIASAANVRAEVYSIETVDRLKMKKIAGRIIPAIATTTALVTGLVNLELMKVLDEQKDGYMVEKENKEKHLERYNQYYINLSIPSFLPSEVPKTKIAEYTTSDSKEGSIDLCWGATSIKDCTLKELLDTYEKKGFPILVVSCGVSLLYAFYQFAKAKERLNMKISELYESIAKTKIRPGQETLVLEVVVDVEWKMDDPSEQEPSYPSITVEL